MSTARTVLLATSNGAGLGHVTRLMAVARRMPSTIEPIVVTQSRGAPIVEREGVPVEYVSSHRPSGLSRTDWDDYLYRRFTYLIDLYEPAAIVFDGVVPYPGMTKSWAGRGLPSLWLRRGLWRPGRGFEFLSLRGEFDLVVEPGDVAGHLDMGATASERLSTPRVDPVTYLDADELLDAESARSALSIPSGSSPVLVSLGAGNIDDTSSATSRAIAGLRRKGFLPVLAHSPIARERPAADGVLTVSVYPLSRFLRAFEFVIGAAGYNSVHEYIVGNVPSLLLPNRRTGLDDQSLRASCMQDLGGSVVCEDVTRVDAALERLSDPAYRRGMRHRLELLTRPNGANALAEMLDRLSDRETEDAR